MSRKAFLISFISLVIAYFASVIAVVYLYTAIVTLFVNDAPALPLIPLVGLVMFTYFVLVESVAVRRLHDFNAGGYLALLLFIPYINFILLLLLILIKGSQGDNKYGPPNTQFSLTQIYRGN